MDEAVQTQGAGTPQMFNSFLSEQVINQIYSWLLTALLLIFIWKVVVPLQSLTAWSMIVLLVSGILVTRLPQAYGLTEVLKYELWLRGLFYLASAGMVLRDWRMGFPWAGKAFLLRFEEEWSRAIAREKEAQASWAGAEGTDGTEEGEDEVPQE